MSDALPSTKPVFFKASIFPPNSISPVSLCKAAENSSGPNSVFGIQKVGGVFRMYPSTEIARTRLLAVGFTALGIRVLPMPVNPRRTFLVDGQLVPSSRLTVSNIPLSVSGEDLTTEIEAAGYIPLSQLGLDCMRDRDGGLTRFRNGNRSLFIRTPTQALSKTIKIQGKFTGFLFYPERDQVEKSKVPDSVDPTPSQPRHTAEPVTTTFDPVSVPTVVVDPLATGGLSNQRESGAEAEETRVSDPGEGAIAEGEAEEASGDNTPIVLGDTQGKPGEDREGKNLREVSGGGQSGSFTGGSPGGSPAFKRSIRHSRARAKSVSPRSRRDTSSIVRYLKNTGGTSDTKRSCSRRKREAVIGPDSPNKRVAPS